MYPVLSNRWTNYLITSAFDFLYMAYQIYTTHRFDKSLVKMRKRGLPIPAFQEVVKLLMTDGVLPSKYRPHKLSGKYSKCWECHITPDWLLIWEQNDMELTLLLVDTGSHSDLF